MGHDNLILKAVGPLASIVEPCRQLMNISRIFLIVFTAIFSLSCTAIAGENEMASDTSVIVHIRANADLVVTIAHQELGKSVGYDRAGAEWLNGYVQRQHEQGNPEIRHGLVQTLGAYLGECIIRSFGGQWAKIDGTWAVRFDARNAAYPFAKVQKHLENGMDDSVLSFYSSIPVLFKGPLGTAADAPPSAAPGRR